MHNKNTKVIDSAISAPIEQAVALAWYSEADYEDILKMMSDREYFPNTYQEWLDLRLELEKELFKEGYRLKRIMIKPKQFVSWCGIHGLQPNAKARAEFAAKQL